MPEKPYSKPALAAALVLLLLSQPVLASEDSANANAEAAGQRAHFTREFCGASAEAVAQYKEKLKKVLTEANEFDARWQKGWRRGDQDAIQMRSLRLSSPAEFAERVKGNCGRIKWLSENSLRPKPPK